ncbi:unnamed protein product [Prorocentrum cordatum]|uniref:PNPLA domain-containing protein n=1 Tax=Prorocentrum cordatum TaxID=2364126 RepID=A0ABN9TDT3_9DINO|nr:unnamed protein product [Polarella glacialis]
MARVLGRFRGAVDDWFASTALAADVLRPGLGSFVAHHTQLFLGSRKGRALRSTRHYLRTRPWARRWHHVRSAEASDWSRCARLLAGRAIGVCFGGGGARGNCHLGVIKAMQELGIPIDVVSGTSFGALVGGIYSMTASEPDSMGKVVRRLMGRQFSAKKMLMDITFPRTAYFTGNYLNTVLKDTFARRRCEDLLVPFACTSTDIVHFESKIHREGPLWRIVRASMSLVGFVPPLPHQERRPEDGTIRSSLLVDGGYVNQYPIETLKDHGAGVVICIVACPDHGPVNTEYGDVVHGVTVTLQRMFCCGRRCAGGSDPPTQADIQERLMFLVESMKESNQSRADLTISPDITGYGLLEFGKYREIEEVGYRAALPLLRDWLAGSGKGPEQVREVIAALEEDAPETKPSIHEVEYGGRQGNAKWRRNLMRRLGSTVTQPLRRNMAGSQPHVVTRSELLSDDSGGEGAQAYQAQLPAHRAEAPLRRSSSL